MKWIVWLSLAGNVWAQEAPLVPLPVAPMQFDAASVKPVVPGTLVLPRLTTDPGRLQAQSYSLEGLIAYAYDLSAFRIVGSRPGLGLFDVEGKADGAHSTAELRVMLQGLLAERFRLKVHREMRELPVDRLVIGNAAKAAKLQATELAEADPRGFKVRPSELGPNFLKASANAMSLEWLANDLSGQSKVVVNDTGLRGVFQFEVDFEVDRAEIVDRSVPPRDAAKHIREDMLSALGLKLQGGRKEPVEVLVIDQVERPEAN